MIHYEDQYAGNTYSRFPNVTTPEIHPVRVIYADGTEEIKTVEDFLLVDGCCRKCGIPLTASGGRLLDSRGKWHKHFSRKTVPEDDLT